MGVVKGAISIKDNATAVLRSIKKEQSDFRSDVEKTKKALQATWDKKRTAKLDATAAKTAADALKKKMEPLRKKIVTAVALKDMATAKITSVTNKVKAVGKMAAKPIVAIKDATAAGLSKIKNGLKSVAKNVVIPVTVAATASAGAVIGGAISQGAKLEQSMGGVETLFKDNSGVVKANADKAFKTAGLSANDYMETVTSFSASLLNSLGGDTAKSAKVADMAIIDMSDNANKFGTDMESIQNAYQGFAKQNYTMLDNLKLGYGGTKEEMSRLLGDATKLTGVKYDMDNLSDVYSAIHAIQENLGVTGTTAKEASATFSGSFAAMKSAASNLLGNLATGGDVTGSMEQLVDSASTFLFNNAVPMIGRVVKALPGAIKTGVVKAAPKIKEAGGSIIKSIKDGMTSMLPSSMGGVLDSFGGSLVSAVQQVSGSVMPVLGSVMQSIQTMLPAVLPVLQTVITQVSSIISSAAPVIGGLVQGIGVVVSTLAPVFQTIFDGIGSKVGTVIDFVGSKMGFIQGVISQAAPLISDILTTAWGVISPVIDIAIGAFKLIFNVVQAVFPGIQRVIQTVWGIIKPIVEGIGSVLSTVGKGINWIADKIGGGGVGANAEGTNNWRGGPTWVGERGPELVDLPKGSRVLPNKESVQLAKGAAQPVVREIVQSTVQQPVVVSADGGGSSPLAANIEKHLGIIAAILPRWSRDDQALTSPAAALRRSDNSDIMPVPQLRQQPSRSAETAAAVMQKIEVTIAKLADSIVVREDADIDKIGEAVAKKVVMAVKNMVPVDNPVPA